MSNIKVLSVQAPWAYCFFSRGDYYPPKDVENRTQRTNYRGRLFIHVSKQRSAQGDRWLQEKFGGLTFGPLPTSCIIGSVDLVACIRESSSQWAFPNYHHWIVKNPVLLERPVLNVKGQLGLWTPKCPLIVDQITGQITGQI